MPTKADGLVPPLTPRPQPAKLSNESGQGQRAARETCSG
ncbi:hypothetical protein BDA96_01G015100 [Sorghum bicolor]|uniref:Uncharacterized protein n=2 Tax=Sorghum bicolor TaxID=4558 RepID=A0A921RWR0_SORBI|nr:hypothetical protein BDA96_01G015100 [Sorghum bicolor]KXG37145.1 hypothetical protein SORBI_3001G014600 [Sorghum bicolor]